jgi:hypothetical protein
VWWSWGRGRMDKVCTSDWVGGRREESARTNKITPALAKRRACGRRGQSQDGPSVAMMFNRLIGSARLIHLGGEAELKEVK